MYHFRWMHNKTITLNACVTKQNHFQYKLQGFSKKAETENQHEKPDKTDLPRPSGRRNLRLRYAIDICRIILRWRQWTL